MFDRFRRSRDEGEEPVAKHRVEWRHDDIGPLPAGASTVGFARAWQPATRRERLTAAMRKQLDTPPVD
jgi:hypothetical protein